MNNILINELTNDELQSLKRIHMKIVDALGLEEEWKKTWFEEWKRTWIEGWKEGWDEGWNKGWIEGHMKSINWLVAAGIMDAKKACDILGVKYETYLKHGTE